MTNVGGGDSRGIARGWAGQAIVAPDLHAQQVKIGARSPTLHCEILGYLCWTQRDGGWNPVSLTLSLTPNIRVEGTRTERGFPGESCWTLGCSPALCRSNPWLFPRARGGSLKVPWRAVSLVSVNAELVVSASCLRNLKARGQAPSPEEREMEVLGVEEALDSTSTEAGQGRGRLFSHKRRKPTEGAGVGPPGRDFAQRAPGEATGQLGWQSPEAAGEGERCIQSTKGAAGGSQWGTAEHPAKAASGKDAQQTSVSPACHRPAKQSLSTPHLPQPSLHSGAARGAPGEAPWGAGGGKEDKATRARHHPWASRLESAGGAGRSLPLGGSPCFHYYTGLSKGIAFQLEVDGGHFITHGWPEKLWDGTCPRWRPGLEKEADHHWGGHTGKGRKNPEALGQNPKDS